jgi:hypothetical protein
MTYNSEQRVRIIEAVDTATRVVMDHVETPHWSEFFQPDSEECGLRWSLVFLQWAKERIKQGDLRVLEGAGELLGFTVRAMRTRLESMEGEAAGNEDWRRLRRAIGTLEAVRSSGPKLKCTRSRCLCGA